MRDPAPSSSSRRPGTSLAGQVRGPARVPVHSSASGLPAPQRAAWGADRGRREGSKRPEGPAERPRESLGPTRATSLVTVSFILGLEQCRTRLCSGARSGQQRFLGWTPADRLVSGWRTGPRAASPHAQTQGPWGRGARRLETLSLGDGVIAAPALLGPHPHSPQSASGLECHPGDCLPPSLTNPPRPRRASLMQVR